MRLLGLRSYTYDVTEPWRLAAVVFITPSPQFKNRNVFPSISPMWISDDVDDEEVLILLPAPIASVSQSSQSSQSSLIVPTTDEATPAFLIGNDIFKFLLCFTLEFLTKHNIYRAGPQCIKFYEFQFINP